MAAAGSHTPYRPQNKLPNTHSVSMKYGLEKEDLFPAHIAVQYGLPETFHMMEVPNKKEDLVANKQDARNYKAIKQYAAQYAVDIHSADTPMAPVEQPSRSKSTREDVKSLLRKTPNKSSVAKRLGNGALTSVEGCTSDEYENFEASSSSEDETEGKEKTDSSTVEKEADIGVYSSSDSEDDGNLSDDSFLSRFRRNRRDKIHGLRKKNSRKIRRFRMGLGYAKILIPPSASPLCDEQVSFDSEQEQNGKISHPTAETEEVGRLVFIRVLEMNQTRYLVVAAATLETVQDFITIAESWLDKRDSIDSKAKVGKFSLYRFTTTSYKDEWKYQGMKQTRPVSSVVLPEGQLDDILNDVRDFVAPDTRAWYRSHGVPHRRSFLFFGAPGTGKTSTIKMLAGLFKLNACFLSFTSQEFSNQSLHDAITHLPSKALLVLEDVDALFNTDRERLTDSSVTFSGLLNVLDGLISTDGIISIFTTNHIDRLDQSLIRGGRIDRRFEFSHPGREHLKTLFRSFYPDCEDATAKKFADEVLKRIQPEEKSIATLQQHFIYTRKMSAEESVQKLPEFFKKFHPYIQDKGSMYMFM